MTRSHFINLEITHDTGIENFWVMGPNIRIGEGCQPPCDLHGSAMGTWIEININQFGEVFVADAYNATCDGSPLHIGRKLGTGSILIMGNALVLIQGVSVSIPSDATVCTSVSGGAQSPPPVENMPRKEEVLKPLVVSLPSEHGNTQSFSSATEPIQPAVVHSPQAVGVSELSVQVEGTDDAIQQAQPEALEKKGLFASIADVFKSSDEQPQVTDPDKAFLAVFEGKSVSRIEITQDELVLGTSDRADVRLTGKRVAEKHLVLTRHQLGWKAKILAARDRTTINGEYIAEDEIKDGSWMVLGGSRVRFDIGQKPLDDVVLPPALSYGAIFSALGRKREDLFRKGLVKLIASSPLWAISIVFHIVLIVLLLLVPAVQSLQQDGVDLEQEFELPGEEEESFEDFEDTEDFEFVEEEDEIGAEELAELEYEDLVVTEGEDGMLGLDAGGLSLPPTSDLTRGKIPGPPRRRPGRGKGKPTIKELRHMGLDIVFLFDTTASMGDLLTDVKTSIDTIYNVVFKLVKTTRFSAVAYRDFEPLDGYVTKAIDFTNALPEFKFFLNDLKPSGGGDRPEAVLEGLNKVKRLRWRKRSYQVVILFTDAPAHENQTKRCMSWAKKFKEEGGALHTVHVNTGTGLEDTKIFLEELASEGGGTYVNLNQEEKVMKSIFTLVFGESNSASVQKALEEYRNEKSKK